MKQMLKPVAAILLAVNLAGPAAAQQASGTPLAVMVQPAEKRPLAGQREFIGRAQALDKVDLRARVQGFLGPRRFKDGDVVKKDQVLFVIEPEPYQAAVEKHEGQRAAAEGAVANAEVQFKRAQELARTNVGTQQTLDQRTAELVGAKGALTEADALLKDARIRLSYTEVRSPIAGRVGRATVPPGNVVGPDSGVLATVVAEQPMHVVFNVTQRELLEARRGGSTADGLKARVRLADDSLYDEIGTLDFIDVQIDPRTDGQTLRATFANKDGALTEGQTVRVILEDKAPTAYIMVPQSTIASDQTGLFLFVVGADNKVEQRRIKAGVERDGLVPIEDGLREGERVIVQGQQRVRPGMVVSPQPAPASANPQ